MHVNSPCRKCGANNSVLNRLNSIGLEFKVVNHVAYFKEPCPQCGVVLWRRKVYLGHLCQKCSVILKIHVRADNHNWKGGRLVNHCGYIDVKVYPDNPFYSMANRHGYIPEHRLVMAQSIGRCLEKWEVIHHKNNIKTDNRLENLEMVLQSKNLAYSLQETRIRELEKQVRLLKFQVRQLRHGNPELGGNETPECRDFIRDTPSGRRESPSLSEMGGNLELPAQTPALLS